MLFQSKHTFKKHSKAEATALQTRSKRFGLVKHLETPTQ